MALPSRILAVALVSGALAATASGAVKATVLTASNASLGKILVSAAGRTLYERAGACTGSCLSRWQPLVVAAKPTAGAGVRAALLGSVERADGRRQVTYAGNALYLFAGDRKAGEALGEGVGGWHAVAPSGAAAMHPMASSASPASSSPPMASGGGTDTTSSGPPAGVNPGMWCAANPKNCVNGVPVTQ